MQNMAKTPLDEAIEIALATPKNEGTGQFDLEKYIAAFQPSAQEKAKAVLNALGDNANFKSRIPVFVSVGGGDGEELDYLLRNSAATAGILLEMKAEWANRARGRKTPEGKGLFVIESAAQTAIGEAIQTAIAAIKSGRGSALVVTCHAVLHELFDRGKAAFDPVGFFGTIFGDETVPTWLTYREPGAPEKWPPAVFISAHCAPGSLIELSAAIGKRHAGLAQLEPKAQRIGDAVRVHRDMAMEILAKLFYLD